MRRTSVLQIALMLCCACSDQGDARQPQKTPSHRPQRDPHSALRRAAPVKASAPAKPSLKLDWDEATGRGHAVQVLSSGDMLRMCFHCKYSGYTGGLVVGNQDGPGYGLYPKKPLFGYRKINVFCAQDESIWDRHEEVEYTYGWSENYGQGDDGKRLKYVRGRIIEGGPDRLVLQSENAAGCYKVTKLAYTRIDVRWWIIATRITNQCSHPVHFDLYSGDDSWIGLYRSSDGDVGWTPEGLIRHESARSTGRFFEGGIYDLGNTRLGQKEGSFSNQANFFKLDPVAVLPDRAIFANSFAHASPDIDPTRPLDNKTLTALNLGWVDKRLAPGKALTVALALGLADTGIVGQIPKAPDIAEHDWSVWRKYLEEGNPPEKSSGIEFAAERVDLTMTKSEMRVKGRYFLRNRDQVASTIGIKYPIDTSSDRPAPSVISVNGKTKPVKIDEAGQAFGRFAIEVPPLGIVSFGVEYKQRYQNRRTVYMVTSALEWPGEITRALFFVRYPESLGKALISYPVEHTRRLDGNLEHLLVFQPFIPDGELDIRWP